jgi:hypothetical protein
MERIIAEPFEGRRKDREEYKMHWRDTQQQFANTRRQIDELDRKIAVTNDSITRLAEESRVADARLGRRINELGVRIDSLVSAIGALPTRDRDSGAR